MEGTGILRREISLAGRPLVLEVGRVARQASSAVLARYGDTVVLATATMAPEPREGIDFFPLLVDYEERHYAVGKIPGGFLRREGKPGEKAILSARLIDRSIRPLFPQKMRHDVHVVTTILSVDQNCAPEITAMIGASAALTLSEIPFAGPIGGVIVGQVDGEWVLNPTVEQEQASSLHLVVAGTQEAVVMVECGARMVPESRIVEAISFGHQAVKELASFLLAFREEALALGLAAPKKEFAIPEPPAELQEAVRALAEPAFTEAYRRYASSRLDKKAREQQTDQLRHELTAQLLERYPEEEATIKELLGEVEHQVVRALIAGERIRADGRGFTEIRPLSAEVGLLPRAHGSALFTRGQTQVLSVVTLGAVGDVQILDDLDVDESKRFLHHYNFPPYSTGEVRPIRSPGRREIGHGALVERALEAVIPEESVFPYTIRIVSEVLESNGSTSMASVCASTLALMDAGVPIVAPVAGIAMGLIKEKEQFIVLTDIQGLEDHLGDMDFKVAGTEEGVTALQMDIKVTGVTAEILAVALNQAREARLQILEVIRRTLPSPRPELSPYAPRVLSLVINPDKIRDVIGPGGKIIRKIIELTGAEIDVEDDGRIFITAPTESAGQQALDIIKNLTAEAAVGQVYLGRVTRVADFGCFVEIIPGVLGLPGKEGLVHVSQMPPLKGKRVDEVFKEGDQVLVKVIGYDNQGRLRLSQKEAMRTAERAGKKVERPTPPSRPRTRSSPK
ncbi:polyribonucleotide nucleotidyltransferase [Desulfothermobacter acidiphilus]|uniref:polyribonucleotide nucleotidyltransferase n=1 Tax=Desulfothermobacter acidiphilus TaxID=1938353 RepID=UPI003F8945D6